MLEEGGTSLVASRESVAVILHNEFLVNSAGSLSPETSLESISIPTRYRDRLFIIRTSTESIS